MTAPRIDRAALVRRAMVELVAERGIHGASMAQVAERAGVATGTAYVHYGSKEELLVAAFVEVKVELGTAATRDVDLAAPAADIFSSLWRGIYAHVRRDPALARFLTQIDESPLRKRAHEALPDDDPLTGLAAAMAPHLVDLPLEILYELGLAPAIRLVASETGIDVSRLELVVESCWRSISRDETQPTGDAEAENRRVEGQGVAVANESA